MREIKNRIFIISLFAITAFSSQASERDSGVVNDLRYGEALYHFYQEQYFSSITDLMVAKERHPITKQNNDPELLLGGLYLYYGLHQKANDIFSGLIKNNTSQETQDRAWFNIGKMQFRGSLYSDAKDTLLKINKTLSPEREAERQNMLANAYMKQHDFNSAYTALKNLQKHQDWETYARYNMGIYLIKAGKDKAGFELLKQISALDTTDNELKTLRDKTNIALGYAYIRNNQPVLATQYLEKVRLKGPLSAKALLGTGWAYQQQDKLEQALVPWLELRNWPVIDTAVQESLLAVPYTLEKIGKNQLALNHYTYAIENYKKELTSLKRILDSVNKGELLQALKPAIITENTLLPEYKNQLPDSISAPYIHHLLSSLDFQQTHKNYLDLIFLRQNLQQWKNQFSAYNLMLSERQKHYSKQKYTTLNDSRLKLVKKMEQKRGQLAASLQRIEQQHDIFALATEEEKDSLSSLSKIKRALSSKKDNPSQTEERNKYNFLYGLLLWDISTDYTPRYWKAKNELNKLNEALEVSNRRLQSLKSSAASAPLSFSGYAAKITAKEKQLNRLLDKITKILTSQEKLIETQAMSSLQKRYHQIENYHTRASYSLARLYDRMTLPAGSNPSPDNKDKQIPGDKK